MGNKQNPETTTREKLPPWLDVAYRDLTRRGRTASLDVSNKPFEGQFFAQPNRQQFRGLEQLLGTGRTVERSGVGEDLLGLAGSTIRGDFLKPGTNPFLQENIDLINRNVTESRDKSLDDINTEFGASGGTNIRQAFENAQVRKDSDLVAGDLVSQLLERNYGNERALQQNAPNLLQSAVGTLDFPGQRNIEVGQGKQALEQMGLDEALAQFTEANEAPFRPLNPLANLLASIRGGGTTTTTADSGVPRGVERAKGALGGATAGGSIGASTGNPYAALILALLGGIGGGLAA